MKIYTKTGDKGKTSLIGGTRVSKSHKRIRAYGTVDELNSYIGLVRDHLPNKPFKDLLKEIQDRLFTIGSSLASDPAKSKMVLPDLSEKDVYLLESMIDEMNNTLPELKNFILPGGNEGGARAHIVRTVARRAERRIVGLQKEVALSPVVIRYINRLSDFAFVLSRVLNKRAGENDIEWSK